MPAAAIWAVCGLLVVAVGLVFGGTLHNQFNWYDEDGFVHQNPHVTPGLSLAGIRWALTDGPYGDWYPVTSISHMLDCQFYGLDPWGHHLTNVLLHAASSVLLFLVLLRMTGDVWPSAWVAAVFAIHPLHVESVAWLAERRDVLAGLFFMLTLGAYALHVERPSPARFLAVAGLFALALMSKPIVVTLPFVLLLLDFWPLRRFGQAAGAPAAAESGSWLDRLPVGWRLVVEKIPLVLLSAASCAIVVLIHKPMQGAEDVESLSLATRAANALVSYAAYLGQSFWPILLSPFYPHPGRHLPTSQAVEALVLLLAISVLVARAWRQRPYLLVGWLWFLGMLVPVSGLVGTFIHARADRYTYLSQIGLSIAVAWGVLGIYRSWQAGRAARRWGWTLAVLSAAAVVALGVVARQQTNYWRSGETIWARAASCDERNVMAHFCLGSIYLQEGRIDEALGQARQALAGDSIARYVTADSYLLLGECLSSQGKIAEAMPYFERAVHLLPGWGRCHSRLAVALARDGQLDRAIAEFREARRLNRDSLPERIDLANALLTKGEAGEAAELCREVLRIDPHSTQAATLLRVALTAQGATNGPSSDAGHP